MGQILEPDSPTFGFDKQLAEFNPKAFYECYTPPNNHMSTPSSKFTKLMFLVQQSRSLDVDKLKEFTSYHIDQLNTQTNEGWNALMIACVNSNTTSTNFTVKMLIDVGADLDLKDNFGNTALMLACKFSRQLSTNDTVQLLINGGCDLNLQNNDGHTALMLACRFSYTSSTIDTVKLLINAGAALNLQDNHGETALMWTIDTYWEFTKTNDTGKLLIDAGADLNLKNDRDYTVLMRACRASISSITNDTIKLLINVNISLKYTDGNNTFTLKILCENCSEDIIKYMLDHANYTEEQLLNCISKGYHTQLLEEYLTKLYYKKIEYDSVILD